MAVLSRAFPKCLRGDEKRPWGRYPRRGFRPDVYISRRLGRCGQGLGASDPVRRYPTRTLAPTLRCVGSGSGSGSGAGSWSGFGFGSGSGRVPLVSLGSQLGHTEPVRLVEHCYPGLAEPSGLRMSQPAPQWRGEVRGSAGKGGEARVGGGENSEGSEGDGSRNKKRDTATAQSRAMSRSEAGFGGPGPKEVDPAQRGWGYNPPNTCAMRIFATIATG